MVSTQQQATLMLPTDALEVAPAAANSMLAGRCDGLVSNTAPASEQSPRAGLCATDRSQPSSFHLGDSAAVKATAGSPLKRLEPAQKLNLILPQEQQQQKNCLSTPVVITTDGHHLFTNPSLHYGQSPFYQNTAAVSQQLLFDSFASHLGSQGGEVSLFTGLPSCTPASADRLAASTINPFFLNASPTITPSNAVLANSVQPAGQNGLATTAGEQQADVAQNLASRQAERFSTAPVSTTQATNAIHNGLVSTQMNAFVNNNNVHNDQRSKLTLANLQAANALSPIILSPLSFWGLSPEQEAIIRYGYVSPNQHPLAGRTFSQADLNQLNHHQVSHFNQMYHGHYAETLSAHHSQFSQRQHYNGQTQSQNQHHQPDQEQNTNQNANPSQHQCQNPQTHPHQHPHQLSQQNQLLLNQPNQLSQHQLYEQEQSQVTKDLNQQKAASVSEFDTSQTTSSTATSTTTTGTGYHKAQQPPPPTSSGIAEPNQQQHLHNLHQRTSERSSLEFPAIRPMRPHFGQVSGQQPPMMQAANGQLQSQCQHKQDMHRSPSGRPEAQISQDEQFASDFAPTSRQLVINQQQYSLSVPVSAPREESPTVSDGSGKQEQSSASHHRTVVSIPDHTCSIAPSSSSSSSTSSTVASKLAMIHNSSLSNQSSDNYGAALIPATTNSTLGSLSNSPLANRLQVDEEPASTDDLTDGDGMFVLIANKDRTADTAPKIDSDLNLNKAKAKQRKPTVKTSSSIIGKNLENKLLTSAALSVVQEHNGTGGEYHDAPIKKKSRGGRKKKLVTHEEMLARKNRSKERNRVAARRCRQKRKQFLDELRDKIDHLHELNQNLRLENSVLKSELETIKQHHRACSL